MEYFRVFLLIYHLVLLGVIMTFMNSKIFYHWEYLKKVNKECSEYDRFKDFKDSIHFNGYFEHLFLVHDKK